MLTCYVIAATLWLEIKTQNATYMYNVDNIRYVYANDQFPNELMVSSSTSENAIYLADIEINDFKTCITEAYSK